MKLLGRGLDTYIPAACVDPPMVLGDAALATAAFWL